MSQTDPLGECYRKCLVENQTCRIQATELDIDLDEMRNEALGKCLNNYKDCFGDCNRTYQTETTPFETVD